MSCARGVTSGLPVNVRTGGAIFTLSGCGVFLPPVESLNSTMRSCSLTTVVSIQSVAKSAATNFNTLFHLFVRFARVTDGPLVPTLISQVAPTDPPEMFISRLADPFFTTNSAGTRIFSRFGSSADILIFAGSPGTVVAPLPVMSRASTVRLFVQATAVSK